VIRRLETGKGAAAGAIVPAARLREIIGLRERLGMCAVQLEDDGQQGFVAMDGMNFDAAIEHLLNNAVEAAGPGTELGIRVRHSTRQVTIEIVDRGPGMSAEFIRDHLFTPFTTSKPAGSGIGAFQARSLLREVGGDLRVASEPGRGTTMGVVLPLLESAARETLSPVA
jgi:signal transduction histidine kinase